MRNVKFEFLLRLKDTSQWRSRLRDAPQAACFQSIPFEVTLATFLLASQACSVSEVPGLVMTLAIHEWLSQFWEYRRILRRAA